MTTGELDVAGAAVFVAPQFTDARGTVVVACHEDEVTGAVGHPLFAVAQTVLTRSRRHTVRGLHYTAGKPGMAKYVYCVSGEALDIVVDVRVGSPTFGRYATVRLAPEDFRAVYLPAGVAHAVLALADDTVMHYLLSGLYRADRERSLSVFDRELNLPLPAGADLLLSERDRAAPTLAAARDAGLLPDYAECQRIEPGALGPRMERGDERWSRTT
ncbi:dTDP-4-dehydrorhamnose 3,5-epimerase family protein [Prauserella cavernicola]|uniref:dTDP-4-dehydrorhamnose 3,5-epimerase family protein n=1 Tax=Prauserella cavernicola TaxID=2800127 RepID=A0A934QWZ6_9PSEU|nr:dTDP-4-dehydrorhamnose 3,5-epimerase [Prauserella cavernicola]MBK1787981.1 dTDP-4-dehydrorhamnose 3,5-epimerase family protein [Prauserella cavernicola]